MLQQVNHTIQFRPRPCLRRRQAPKSMTASNLPVSFHHRHSILRLEVPHPDDSRIRVSDLRLGSRGYASPRMLLGT